MIVVVLELAGALKLPVPVSIDISYILRFKEKYSYFNDLSEHKTKIYFFLSHKTLINLVKWLRYEEDQSGVS